MQVLASEKGIQVLNAELIPVPRPLVGLGVAFEVESGHVSEVDSFLLSHIKELVLGYLDLPLL